MKLLKNLAIAAVMLTVIILPRAGMALDLNDGFFDIPWGGYVTDLKGFEELGKKMEVTFYVKPDRAYQINDIDIANVVYGFYADRFFAVYISVEGIDVFGHLRKYITQKYGSPRMKLESNPQQTIYSWRHQRVKIKMKHREIEGRMKLSFYYTPIAGKANRAQAEAFEEPPKVRFPLSEQKKKVAVEHFNLLNF